MRNLFNNFKLKIQTVKTNITTLINNFKLKIKTFKTSIAPYVQEARLEFYDKFFNKNKIKEVDLQYMTDSSAATLEGAPIGYHMILWACIAFLFVALIWANFAVLDVVTVGEGKVIPSSKLQIVQNLEGGIIKEIHVKEGDSVVKNQILMVIDDTRFASSYTETAVQVYALKAKIVRLTAEAQGLSLIFEPELIKKYPTYVQNETNLYNDRNSELKKKLQIQKEQADQKLQELKEMQGKRDQLKKSLALATRELTMTRPMRESGAVSEVELLRLERTVNDIGGDLLAAQTAIPRLESALSSEKNKLDDIILSFRSSAGKDLNDAKAEYNRLFENIKGAEDRLVRTQVRSPVKGTINQLLVNTIGAVVQPGANLIEIVPSNDSLLIEVDIRPKDIGFLSIGLPATVKISAYDFSIYGGFQATVEHISSTTIPNAKGDPFYKILVRTKEKTYLVDKVTGEKLYISPGMSATVDILTGHKSVLDYILKPILKTRENALHER